MLIFGAKKFKLGLDIHGVIDANPVMFSNLTKRLLKVGTMIESYCEVHIITGAHITEAIIKRLRDDFKIEFTHTFSIVDHHKKIGTEIWYDRKNTPWMEGGIWDKTKAEYCAKHDIDLHIDDTERYGKYFTTPFMLYKA